MRDERTAEYRQELQLTPELIESFLEARKASGFAPSSLASYERMLGRLYELLPGDKRLRVGMLPECAQTLKKRGYAPQTVNVFLAAAEGLMKYGGLHVPQMERQTAEAAETPEISRSEYIQLLRAAKQLDKPRAYYLIKCFAVLGINIRDVERVTVEAVEAGVFSGSEGIVRIPEELRKELRRYARAEGIVRGPLFRGRDGEPMQRTNVNKTIIAVGSRTKVPLEKCTPRALRKLHSSTQERLLDRIQVLLDREYEKLLAEEKLSAGWYYS